MDRLDEFEKYRQRMNDRINEVDHLGIKRFFNLDTRAYNSGALDAKNQGVIGSGCFDGAALQRLY